METSIPIDILIVTALPEEIDVLTHPLNLNSEPSFFTTSTPYYLNPNLASIGSESKTYSVAVFCLNTMGNTNAGIVVTHALRDLNPSYVFMFGIAGGIKDEVDLADVIIPDQIFYTAIGKYRSDGLEPRPETLRIDAELLQRLHAYAFDECRDKEYKVKVGPFAVGEQVIANNNEVAKLRKIHPKLIGLEMESYGVGLAVFNYSSDSSFVAVRGVSDYADEQKSDDHRGNALKNAANFLVGFIKAGRIPKKQNKSKTLPKFIAIHHLSLYRRQSINQAIYSYLKHLQNFDVVELPIDQVDLYQDGSLANLHEAVRRQKELLGRLNDILQANPACDLGYFGLAHIPLVFHLGYEINRREVQVFGNDYNRGEWFYLPEKTTSQNVLVEGFPEATIEQIGDVFIVMSVSYAVNPHELAEFGDHQLATIHIHAENPQLGLVDSLEILNTFTHVFRESLQRINHQFPNVQRIHVFYAGQPTLAFRCGQQINRNVDPEIIVYNYSRRESPHYRWALSLQTGEVIERNG